MKDESSRLTFDPGKHRFAPLALLVYGHAISLRRSFKPLAAAQVPPMVDSER